MGEDKALGPGPFKAFSTFVFSLPASCRNHRNTTGLRGQCVFVAQPFFSGVAGTGAAQLEERAFVK